jgi:peptidoglycan hydrolase-like protein with peptidoglycan-binding domain
VFPSRTPLATGLCLLLTAGTVVNVVLLQSGHRAEPAYASPLPATTPRVLTVGTPGLDPDPAAAADDPVGSLMASADADLAMRTTDGAVALATAQPIDDDSDNAKLVTAIQRELAAHGYDPGKVNGKAGIVTRSAILAYQFDQHLVLTADPSPELLRQIVMGLSGSPEDAQEPASGKASRIIGGAQRLLVRLGYKPGPIDGQLNDVTRKALRRFEGDSGFVPKGRVSGEVIAELARLAKARIETSDEALAN